MITKAYFLFTLCFITLLSSAQKPELMIPRGHAEKVDKLSMSPDGKLLASGSWDKSVRIWDITSGRELKVFENFPRWVNSVVFSPDGKRLAAGSFKELRVFDMSNNGTILFSKQIHPDDITTLAYNPGGTVLATASAPDDTIDEIRLYQNGKLITTTNRNMVVDNDKSNEQTKAFTITLNNGANEIKAVAINSQRTESVPDEIILNYKPQANNIINNTTTLHLMVVALNTYKNPKYNLNYALADATAFKDEIEKNSSSIYGSVKLHFITDADAMKANIESNFKAIASEAKPQDVFIFYYAGHGVMNGDDKKKDFYIVPYDVVQLYGADDALAQKGISAAVLQDFSKNIAAQKQLFILDACQSAGALEAVASRGVAEEKAIAQLARSTGTHWLTASGSEQYAEEFSQLGHGVFTYALLQGLQGRADNGDHQITVNKLKAYLETAVPELTQKYKGAAQYPASYGFGNDFPVEVIK